MKVSGKYLNLVGFLFILLLHFTGENIQAQQYSGTLILAGYHHKPAVTTPASGTVIVQLKKDTLIIDGSFERLMGEYTSAGIYYGKKGEIGNRILKLKADLNEDRTGGEFNPEKNKFKLNEAQKKILFEGEFYINVHTTEHRHGEIRGQLPGKI